MRSEPTSGPDVVDVPAVEELVRRFAGIIERVAGAQPLPARWGELCRATTDLLGCDRTSVLLHDGTVFRTEASHGNPSKNQPRLSTRSFAADDPLVEELRRRQEVCVIEDPRTSPLVDDSIASDAGLAIAPMWDDRRRLAGMLVAEYDECLVSIPRVDRELIGGLAHLASILAEEASDAAVSASEEGADADSRSMSSGAGVLSPREMELFELLCRGCTNEEAARQLHRSVRTIESHRGHIMKKLGATTRADMMAAAVDLGIIQFRTSPSSATNQRDVAADPTQHGAGGTRCTK